MGERLQGQKESPLQRRRKGRKMKVAGGNVLMYDSGKVVGGNVLLYDSGRVVFPS